MLQFNRRLGQIRSLSRQFSASMYAGNGVIGIVREHFSEWERRAPLTPEHVKSLVRQGIRVNIQPSTKRVFSDMQYEQVGAEITEDLKGASVIFGVKQVPLQFLLPEKTYMFFSHVIKAQSQNMALLDECIKQKIRLIDYECIRAGGTQEGSRLVAFGGFAGTAGMIDIFQGIGRRLLAAGFNTPFLNIPQAYTMHSVQDGINAVKQLANDIRTQPIPHVLQPLIFGFTASGNVSHGAQSIFSLLPHQYVTVAELPKLIADVKSGKRDASHKVFGVVIEADNMVKRTDDKKFDMHDYQTNPASYVPIFHDIVAPYLSVLVNCMYWDAKFPRLLTRDQIRQLWLEGKNRLFAVADISCDIEGSLEFLGNTTNIEKPFFSYNPLTSTSSDVIDGSGIVVLGVDILPSELPRDASAHFGNCLMPFLPKLSTCPPSRGFDDFSGLSPEIAHACITNHGKLSKAYEYISTLRSTKSLAAKLEEKSIKSFCHVIIRGHLFDFLLINRILDIIDHGKASFSIDHIHAGITSRTMSTHTTVVIKLHGHDDVHVSKVVESIREFINHSPPAAEVSMDIMGETTNPTLDGLTAGSRHNVSILPTNKRVLLFGSGMVATPVVAYLSGGMSGSSGHCYPITIAGNDINHINYLATRAIHGNSVLIDVSTASVERIDELVRSHDVIISLLPTTLHVKVAERCVHLKKHLVTASYVSPQMKALDVRAKQNGIVLLNEMGLDPGIDHMAIMKIIDEVKQNQGTINRFLSVCGGLPAPDCATNPFAYKFSWSPKGALKAMRNNAIYREDGKTVEINGNDLLSCAKPARYFPTLNLEVYPNRDSIYYGDFYGIPQSKSIFRGTMRYSGYCALMKKMTQLGLFEDIPLSKVPSKAGSLKWIHVMSACSKLSEADVMKLIAASLDLSQALDFLEIRPDEIVPIASETKIDSWSVFDEVCAIMTNKMLIQPNERDLVAMYHEIEAEFVSNGVKTRKLYSSELLMTGSDSSTAMARTVGLPCAIGAELILQGKVKERGVAIPTSKEIYVPVLEKLNSLGIKLRERTSVIG